MSKRKFFLCVLLLLSLSANAFAQLHITVEYNKGWGNAPTSNIKKLCENVALHFQEQLRDEHKIHGDLLIVYRAERPIVYYRTFFGGDADDYKIGLSITGRYWDEFSYQFGHEFAHILQNHDELYEKLPNQINDWFEEAICELANLWVLRRMHDTWASRPPYNNWVDYRHALLDYANWHMNRPEVQYDGSGAEWLAEWEDAMRRDEGFTYARVSQLSHKFLPIFEENPEAWNIIRQMPVSNAKMSVYMKEWYDAVDTEDKVFVEAIAREMGISVTTVVPIAIAAIDADVNGDGYVDLYDVLIVRSGMQKDVSYDTDINNDDVTDEIDLLIVKAKAHEAIAAAAPSKRKTKLTTWGALKRQ
ncbi:MAG: hypothetical protein OXU51_01085 [Candidatus Poribacteria bacterium]|nr:hypothetical protein [Candidatus Poribacteria bacterium]